MRWISEGGESDTRGSLGDQVVAMMDPAVSKREYRGRGRYWEQGPLGEEKVVWGLS